MAQIAADGCLTFLSSSNTNQHSQNLQESLISELYHFTDDNDHFTNDNSDNGNTTIYGLQNNMSNHNTSRLSRYMTSLSNAVLGFVPEEIDSYQSCSPSISESSSLSPHSHTNVDDDNFSPGDEESDDSCYENDEDSLFCNHSQDESDYSTSVVDGETTLSPSTLSPSTLSPSTLLPSTLEHDPSVISHPHMILSLDRARVGLYEPPRLTEEQSPVGTGNKWSPNTNYPTSIDTSQPIQYISHDSNPDSQYNVPLVSGGHSSGIPDNIHSDVTSGHYTESNEIITSSTICNLSSTCSNHPSRDHSSSVLQSQKSMNSIWYPKPAIPTDLVSSRITGFGYSRDSEQMLNPTNDYQIEYDDDDDDSSDNFGITETITAAADWVIRFASQTPFPKTHVESTNDNSFPIAENDTSTISTSLLVERNETESKLSLQPQSNDFNYKGPITRVSHILQLGAAAMVSLPIQLINNPLLSDLLYFTSDESSDAEDLEKEDKEIGR